MYIKTGTGIRSLASESQGAQISAMEQQNKSSADMTKESKTSSSTVSSQGDLLSISKEGVAASSQMKNQSDTQEQTQDGMVILESAEGKVTKSESDVSTINLSNYTETELSQMYRDGNITKAEYDKEISSRET